jgi:hypothetical protein
MPDIQAMVTTKVYLHAPNATIYQRPQLQDQNVCSAPCFAIYIYLFIYLL